MEQTIGFIGVGNMGGALARAAARAVDPGRIVVSNRSPEKAEALSKALSCRVATATEVAESCDLVFLGVKPQMMAGLLEELQPALERRITPVTLVSMAAGVSMAQIRAMAGGDYPVIRIMPNTPVAVGQGVVLYDQTENVSVEAKALFLTAMGTAGLLDPLEERLMDAGSAVAGCGPAFADLFMEALADGGVLCGLPRAKAQAYAAQMLLGAASLAMETELHPGQLKDAVCSPGGSTIAGVKTLEQFAFRAAVIDAVEAAFEKTKALGN